MLQAQAVAARPLGRWSASGQRADGLPTRLDPGHKPPPHQDRHAAAQREARDLNWLIGNFATKTPSVAHAMVVSAGGLPVAVSDRLDRPMADQLAAIASGLASLLLGAASLLDCGLVKQTVVEMDRGLLIVMSISDGSRLAVLAAAPCDVGVVAYQMTVLVARVGEILTPTLRAELQAALPA